MQTGNLRLLFPLLVVLPQPTAAISQPAPLPEADHSTVGYETVAKTLEALRSKSGVVFNMENGWLIATDEEALTIWSFAPQGYPAYPAVVQRKVVPQGSG